MRDALPPEAIGPQATAAAIAYVYPHLTEADYPHIFGAYRPFLFD